MSENTMQDIDRSYESLLLLEDVLQQDEDWRGVPDCIKISFKACHMLMKSNMSILMSTNENMEKKAEKEEVKKAFKLKANIVDVEESMYKIHEAIDNKVGIEDIEGVLNEGAEAGRGLGGWKGLESRVDRLEKVAMALEVEERGEYVRKQEVDVLYDTVGMCVKGGEVEEMVAEGVERLAAEIGQTVEEVTRGLSSKASVEEVRRLAARVDSLLAEMGEARSAMREVTSTTTLIQKGLDGLHGELKGLHTVSGRVDGLVGKVGRLEASEARTQEIIDILSTKYTGGEGVAKKDGRERERGQRGEGLKMEEIVEYVDKKLKKVEGVYVKKGDWEAKVKDYNEVMEALRETTKDLHGKVKKNMGETDQRIRDLGQRLDGLKQAPLEKPRREKERAGESTKGVKDDSVEQKVYSEKVKKIDEVFARVGGLVEERGEAAKGKKELEERLRRIEEKVEEKVDRAKVCRLIDKKAEIEDVNKALVGLHDEIDKCKAAVGPSTGPGGQIRASPGGQLGSNPYRLGAMFICRCSNNSGIIAWDNESFNSDAGAVVWDRAKTGIMLVHGGLYELSFGFFGSNKPHVELLLNQETILTSLVARPQEREKQVGHFEQISSAGNVTGLTCIEYFIMPPKAKINFIVKGSLSYEGFLLIKKL